jgi:hypothetical protein
MARRHDNVASWVRKLIGVTATALVAGTFAFAGVAGAGIMIEPGEGAAQDPGCSFTVVINEPGGVIPAGATSTTITVTGAIGGDFSGALVSLVLNGQAGPPIAVNPGDGSFVFGPLVVALPLDVSISYSFGNENAYTNFCIGPGGQSVVRVQSGAVVRPAAVARSLAFTGSDDTTRNVLIGVAAVVLGTGLVMGTRRRNRIKA